MVVAAAVDSERLSGSRWQVFGDEALDTEGPFPLPALAWSYRDYLEAELIRCEWAVATLC